MAIDGGTQGVRGGREGRGEGTSSVDARTGVS
jgi:hypothetical protein